MNTSRIAVLPTPSFTARPRQLAGSYGRKSFQGEVEPIHQPIRVRHAVTHSAMLDAATSAVATTLPLKRADAFEPPSFDFIGMVSSGPDAAPIQVWEGTVLSVDERSARMAVRLLAKMGAIPEHTGEIELEWVAPQDMDLVVPGAVFYLTLYKKRRAGGTLENSQELRFRRRPDWSEQQVRRVMATADQLLAKMRPSPLPE